MKNRHSHPTLRMVSALLIVALVATSVPAQADTPPPREAPPQELATQAEAKPGAPATSQPALPAFSTVPTDEEIFRARIFAEPLWPIGGTTTPAENQALASALLTYVRGADAEVLAPLLSFLQAYPNSPWRASLLTNLGIVYRRRGYFSRALEAWQEAWSLSRMATEPRAAALADRALGDFADLSARVGRYETLEPLFTEIAGRNVRGSATEKLAGARQGLALMRSHPEEAFRCGPLALDRILAYGNPAYRRSPLIQNSRSTPRGISLTQVKALSRDLGMQMQMAKRTGTVPIPLPAVVHWRSGHYAALLRQEGEYLLVQDPTFGDELWVSRRALNDEASDYFLLPSGSLPSGFRAVGEQEGGEVWGKGIGGDPQNQTSCDRTVAGNGAGCTAASCQGMATYAVHAMLVSLNITDIPVGYTPARGPTVQFRLTYNQRDAFQPQNFTHTNLGSKWTFDWISYLEVDSDPNAPAYLYARGGGQETYLFTPGSPSSAPHPVSRAFVVRNSPSQYVRHLPDGSREVFSLADGPLFLPHRVFMTQWYDPQGNALTFNYANNQVGLRLLSVTDSLGQITQISYGDAADPLKITKVRDPFAREALFEYNANGRLAKITDVIGIASEFTYGSFDFISTLTTPYGTTTFSMGDSSTGEGELSHHRWLEAVDPLGGRERVEYVDDAGSVPVPPEQVPQGFVTTGMEPNRANTFYWDKLAIASYPDRSKAHIFLWLKRSLIVASGTLHSEKKPRENRIWYAYPGQPDPRSTGTAHKPIKIARVLDDNFSQILQYAYNAKGKVIQYIDPLTPTGRQTRYTYGTGSTPDADQANGTGIDLLKVEQKNGGVWDVLSQATYDAQHQVLTSTDASGQTTTFKYFPDGRVEWVKTPPRNGPNGQPLTDEERKTTYAYYPDTDSNPARRLRLQTITGPFPQGAPTTTYDYDTKGRVLTMRSDPDNYVLTYAYDDLDRQTRVTYPDTTYEETVYNPPTGAHPLDPAQHRDRLGRWSRSVYDALRRLTTTRDALGRTVERQYCTCGSLDRVVDGNGNSTEWEYDDQGRVVKEKRPGVPLPASWVYGYEDTTSRLETVTDPKGQTKSYAYFLDNTLKQVSYSGGSILTPTVSYTYDPAHNRLATMNDGTGQTTYQYHPYNTGLGRGLLKDVIHGPDTVSYTYDEMGRMATRGPASFQTNFAYDSLGRLTREGSPLGNFNYTYAGPTDRVTSLKYPNNQLTSLAYEESNEEDRHLKEIKHQVAQDGATLSQFNYTYDDVGNIETWRQQYAPPATAEQYELGYDRAYQLISATLKNTATPPVTQKHYGYAYDPAGNRTAAQLDAASTEDVPNARNQLVTRRPGGALVFQGTLNEPATVTIQGRPATVTSDNRFAGTAPPDAGTSQVTIVAQDYAQPAHIQTNVYPIPSSGTTTSYAYDDNGNLCAEASTTSTTCVAGTRRFEWDAENRLVAVKEGATTLASFTYDGQGRRVTKTAGGATRTYVYDQEDIVEERAGVTSLKYVHGPGIDQPLASRDQADVATYFLADHLGSIVQTTNSSAGVNLMRKYDPWGNLLQGSSTNSGYGFTGREWDAETGLYYYRARYYDPKLGRFLSEDPIGLIGGSNLYEYVSNNPAAWTDPLGTIKWRPNVRWEPCNADERKWCEEKCSAKGGVKSCNMMIVKKLKRFINDDQIPIKINVEERIWPPQCLCNKEDDEPKCGPLCVPVLVVFTYLCLQEYIKNSLRKAYEGSPGSGCPCPR